MEDFSALAARIAANVGELRGCLILSRDGLELGSYPAGEEALVKPAWLRFAHIGDPKKGFVEFGDDLWVYVRRGPYAVFAVSAANVRPGLIMDQLEQLLFAAEEARSRREALKVPEVQDAPKSRPRTSLHKEARQAVGRLAGSDTEAAGEASGQGDIPEESARPEPPPGSTAGVAPDPEVDRVLLAQEFSRLLQESRSSDEEQATERGGDGQGAA